MSIVLWTSSFCLMFETPLEPLGRGKMGVLLCQ
jgi:hypothetical protein